MIKIQLANTLQDYQKIDALADCIWRAHYIPLVGKPQVDYMLDKFQTAKAIEEQVKRGLEYYKLIYDDITCGYLAIKNETDALFLSKLYILSNYRGKKIGKTAISFIEEKAKTYQLKKIRLTVNIDNTNSIKAYETLGFKNVGSIVADIGGGFVMDDYELVKNL